MDSKTISYYNKRNIKVIEGTLKISPLFMIHFDEQQVGETVTHDTKSFDKFVAASKNILLKYKELK